MQDHAHPSSPFPPIFPRFFLSEPRMTSCLNTSGNSQAFQRDGEAEEESPNPWQNSCGPHRARTSPFEAWSGVGATLHEVLHELLLPCVMLYSTPGVAGHEETQTGLQSWARPPMSKSAMLGYREGRIQRLTVPAAQPPVFVIIPLCGSNNNFIFNCGSPQREFA